MIHCLNFIFFSKCVKTKKRLFIYLYLFIYLSPRSIADSGTHRPNWVGSGTGSGSRHWSLSFWALDFYLFLSIELHSAYYKNETFLFCFPKRSSRLRLSAQSNLKIGSGAALKSAAPAPAPQHWIIEKVLFLEKILGWGFLLFSGQNLNFLKIWSIFDDVGPHQFHQVRYFFIIIRKHFKFIQTVFYTKNT